MYKVRVSETFQKQFSHFDKKFQKRIESALKILEPDPFKPRPGADIIPIKNTKPQKYRLRVGDYRIVYRVERKIVKVIEVFPRGRGYKE